MINNQILQHLLGEWASSSTIYQFYPDGRYSQSFFYSSGNSYNPFLNTNSSDFSSSETLSYTEGEFELHDNIIIFHQQRGEYRRKDAYGPEVVSPAEQKDFAKAFGFAQEREEYTGELQDCLYLRDEEGYETRLVKNNITNMR
ncbi:MAG TPA: hypothetical protein PK228_11300 [Saprospiraceae bacterium]|nr:hypothetical protein [Saprospiraceae bacterium]